jgi:hypothetical protein
LIVSIFRRRLKEGGTFEDFKAAWEADKGFGAPARVFSAISLKDPREVLTVGLVDVEAQDLAAELERMADQEKMRHDRIDDVIESTELKTMYAVASEHDFTATPREISIGSADSLLAALRT